MNQEPGPGDCFLTQKVGSGRGFVVGWGRLGRTDTRFSYSTPKVLLLEGVSNPGFSPREA